MPLQNGARLGPYEIVSPLGAGGMGEVYKARDTRLERTVAIKVLPADVSSDPDLRNNLSENMKPATVDVFLSILRCRIRCRTRSRS